MSRDISYRKGKGKAIEMEEWQGQLIPSGRAAANSFGKLIFKY